MRVRWTRPALLHLREIAEYIEQENPPAARRVVQSIREQVATGSMEKKKHAGSF